MRSDVGGGEGNLPRNMSHDGFDVTNLIPPHGQTDACENITFPQLSLRAVMTLPCIYNTLVKS